MYGCICVRLVLILILKYLKKLRCRPNFKLIGQRKEDKVLITTFDLNNRQAKPTKLNRLKQKKYTFLICRRSTTNISENI